MKILLPDYDCTLCDGAAEVKDHILYLYKIGAIKEVMYTLAYMIFGNDECYYCHRKLRTHQKQCDNKRYFSKISMDHLIPQDFGGPTITNNLRPACTDCNTRKGNLFEDEYAEYLEVIQRTAGRGKLGRQEKRLFREKILLKQELRRFGNEPSLPKEWIAAPGDIKNIWVNYWIGQKKGGSYGQMVADVQKYNYLIKPVTITANGVVVDGFNANLVATFFEVTPIIIPLENVIQCGYPFGERRFLT